MNCIVTGASRGIGLELTKFALNQGHQVLAVVRSLASSPELQQLKSQYTLHLEICEADVTGPETPAKIASAVKHWPSVDLLINNAGIFEKEKTRAAMLSSFETNAIAPLFIAEAMLPLLQQAPAPKLVNITSKMGSIEDNTTGGYYSYRASKVALNMLNRSLALDNPWLISIVIHPGWVQTDMGGKAAPTSPKESAQGIWGVTEKLKSTDSGEFFDFKGEALPW